MVESVYLLAPLGTVLKHYQEYIDAPELKLYPKLSVKLYGRGVVLDGTADGALLKMKRHQISRAGQVILSEIWGKKGAIGFVPPEGEGALCTSHFFLFDVIEDRLDPRYLQLIFTANYLEEQLGAEARGTTGYAAVRPRQLLASMIPLPSLAEQRRIVGRVEALAERIEKASCIRHTAQSELESAWPSMLNAAFSPVSDWAEGGGEDARQLLFSHYEEVHDRPRSSFNRARLSEPSVYTGGIFQLSIGWIWTDLGSVLTHLVDCVNDTPDFSPVPTPFLGLKTTNVRPYRLDLSERWYVTEQDFSTWNRREMPQAGDIILTREAPVGKSCMLPEDVQACLTQRLLLLRPNRRVIVPRYLLHYLNSPRFLDQVRGSHRGMTTPHIRVADAPGFLVPLAPMAVQHCIVAYLDDLQAKVDGLKRLQAETEAELGALLPAVLDRAFRGEL